MVNVYYYYADCPKCDRRQVSRMKDYLPPGTHNYEKIPDILDLRCPFCNTLIVHSKSELKTDWYRDWGL